MKINIKGLDHYFEAVRNQAPVLSLEEVRTLIQQPAAALGKPGKEGIKQTASIQKMLLTSNVLTVVAAVLACWSGMVSGNPMEQEEISSRQVAMSATLEEEPKLEADKQMPDVSREITPDKGASSPMPLTKQVPMAETPDPIPLKAPAMAPATLRPLAVEEELKSVAEPVPAASIISLGKEAVKAGNPYQASPVSRKPDEREKVNPPVAVVEIDSESARKLGFTLNEQGIRFEMEAPLGIEHITQRPPNRLRIEVSNHVHVMLVTRPPGAKTNEGKVITEYVTSQATSFSVHPGRNPRIKTPPHPYPLFITDATGIQRVKYKLAHEDQNKMKPAYFNEIINALVPVLVKANNAANDQAIFWFERSDAFLAALPAGQREALRPESQKTKSHREKPEALPAYKAKETGKSKPLNEKAAAAAAAAPAGAGSPPVKPGDLGRTDLNAVQDFMVFPNPASGAVNMDVRFRQPEAVTIYLADIAGSLVKVLKPMQLETALTSRYQFDLSGIAPGMYVVVMKTKRGHTFAQRLIIQ